MIELYLDDKYYNTIYLKQGTGEIAYDFIKIGNSGQSNGFWINSGIINENLLNSPKVYDFQRNKELTEENSKLNELEIFEINF